MISYNRFTLVEVLVAASISVIVLSIISGTAWSTLQAVDAGGRRMDMSGDNAALIRRISEDLRGCRLQVHRSSAELLELEVDEEEPPTFYAESDGQGVWLDMFTTGAVTGPALPAGLYRVFYRFQAREGVLERRQAHIAQVEVEGLDWRVVADGLESVEMSFFDGEQWQSEWDSNEEGELPFSIKISITRQQNGNDSHLEFIVSPRIRN